MNIKIVGIIGGKGKMGQYFAGFFINRGFEVLLADINTTMNNEEVANKSDLLIFSVPINLTVEIINSLKNHIRPETILFDLTSIKKPALEAMLATKAQEVVGGHPMFAPSVSIMGQVFVLTPGRGENGLNFLQQILTESRAKVKIIDAQKHDELMTVVQSLNHFTDIAFAKALSKTGLEIHDFLELQSPAYRLKLVMMGRILAQSSQLYGSILTQNPLSPQSIKLFEDSVAELSQIVKNHDLASFEKYFQDSANYLEDFTQIAMQESDMIIEQMFQRKVDIEDSEQKMAKIAILGPKNTYSDFACDKLGDKYQDRKYCRTIREVVENVVKDLCPQALVPIENNLAGSVHETYDALWDFNDEIEVIKEMELPLTHVLVALKEIPINQIESVFSHAQPLMQCSRFFEQNRHIKKIAVASTADAVLYLTGNKTAIIPKQAAIKAHLNILKENMANSADNFTRFYLIQKKVKEVLAGNNKAVRTSLAFELFKTKAGALLKVLQFFADENLNLLKLESKPVGDKGDTIFFVEVEGGMNIAQINELKTQVAILKIFGFSYKIDNIE